jgi:hypothetical protein
VTKTTDYEIVGSYNNQRVTSIDAERSVNVFEYHDPLGKKPKSLIYTSGLSNTALNFQSAMGGFRAQYVFKGIEYCIIGSTFLSINSSGVVAILGTLINSFSGYVGIDANTFQLIFVDGHNGYIWDTISNTFTIITDPAFPALPLDVCYLDGFFIVVNGNTNTFQLDTFNQGLIWGPDNNGSPTTFTMAGASSHLVLTYSGGSIANYQVGTPIVFSGGGLPAELVAGTTYYVQSIVNATTITVSATDGGSAITSAAGGNGSFTNNGQLQLGSITTHPGTIVACRTLHRRLFLFSQNFTEVWENQGVGSNLPFRRNNSLLMEYGTPAIGSIATGFDTMFFLSQDRDGLGSVMEVRGTESIPASTRALDFEFAQYAALGQVADCRAFLIKENGLIFYRMNFTLANHTFIYNVTQSKPSFDPEQDAYKYWHEEEVLDGDRHPAQTHAYFNGINYVGDYANPILYAVSSDIFTNNGEVIRRMRITRAFVPPGYQRIRIDRLQIDVLQGNIAQIQGITQDIDLYTENNFTLETESGQDIILEEGLTLLNPQQLYIFMSLSKDGGQTYGYSVKAPMGNIGQRTFRTLWRKLGTTKRGQAFVAKFEFFGTVPFVVLGASWAVEVLPE